MLENTEKCSFCELLKDVQKKSKHYASVERVPGEDRSYECKAALVLENCLNGDCMSKTSYNPRKLNFCPMCGREIAKEEICW